MNIICTDESGFEDQLTEGEGYMVKVVSGGGSDYLIENDKGDVRWYGEAKFEVVL